MPQLTARLHWRQAARMHPPRCHTLDEPVDVNRHGQVLNRSGMAGTVASPGKVLRSALPPARGVVGCRLESKCVTTGTRPSQGMWGRKGGRQGPDDTDRKHLGQIGLLSQCYAPVYVWLSVLLPSCCRATTIRDCFSRRSGDSRMMLWHGVSALESQQACSSR